MVIPVLYRIKYCANRTPYLRPVLSLTEKVQLEIGLKPGIFAWLHRQMRCLEVN